MAHELWLAIAYFIPNVKWKGRQEEIDIKGTVKSPEGDLVAESGVQNESSHGAFPIQVSKQKTT